MKKGWTYKKVGDVFKTYSGGTPIKSHKEYYENGDIPWIRSGEVCRKYITESEMFITRAGLENSSAKFFPVDTVLVAMYGATAAQVGILKIRATSNQAVCGILPNENFSPEFVYYWFKLIESDLASQAQGGAQPNISQEKIKKVEFPIISLAEQERIVERLDAAFAQIDELKSNAEKQLAEARALFQSALTQSMQPKPGWQEKTLGDITTSMADGPFGSNLKKEHYSDRPEVRIIQLSNIGEDGWREENTKYTTFEHLKSIQRSEVLPGDIVIAKMMPAGRAIICPSHEAKFVLSSDAVRATLKENLNRRFVLYAINSPYFRKQVYENVSGSGRVRTSLTKLRACKLFIPSNDMQDKVVKQIDSMDRNIRELEEINSKTAADCDALKQALLRQIFE